jgi:hypothetical protein
VANGIAYMPGSSTLFCRVQIRECLTTKVRNPSRTKRHTRAELSDPKGASTNPKHAASAQIHLVYCGVQRKNAIRTVMKVIPAFTWSGKQNWSR